MKKLVILLLAFSVACSSSKDDKQNDNNGSGNAGKQNDTTDYTACERGTPTNDIRGVWKQSLESNGLTGEMLIEIGNDHIRMTNICEAEGRRLTVSAAADAAFNDSTLSVLGSDQDEKSINDSDFKMNCQVNLRPSKFQYTFQGSCLVMKEMQSQETRKFVPAR